MPNEHKGCCLLLESFGEGLFDFFSHFNGVIKQLFNTSESLAYHGAMVSSFLLQESQIQLEFRIAYIVVLWAVVASFESDISPLQNGNERKGLKEYERDMSVYSCIKVPFLISGLHATPCTHPVSEKCIVSIRNLCLGG